MRSNTRAHLAVLLTNLFFATNFSLVKYISPAYIGPYGVNVVRVGVSMILFWIVWLFGKSAIGIQQKHLFRFILCGLTGVALNQMLFIKGLTMTSTIHAALLMLCTPLLITILAFWFLKEKISLAKAIGIALGIGGASILILSKDSSGGTSLQGDLLIVLNATAYTFYFILAKPLMNEYTPLQVVRWVFTFGFLMILPFGWTQFSEVHWQQWEWTHLVAISFVVLCGTFLAYYFTTYGLQKLSAGTTGAYIYTQPLFAAAIAALFLNEHFTFQKILAGVLIFVGVFMVSRKSPPVIEE